MKILHYSTGFDTDKGGGITKYTTDLMCELKKRNEVIFLYPGEILMGGKIKIKKNKQRYGIKNYRIINPIPIPFMNGINVEDYLNRVFEENVWRDFFEEEKPDIFHIHTLIGLPLVCIKVAFEKKIPMIYTTHDYFGICAKQSLFYKNTICKQVESCVNCPECNLSALSRNKLILLHSKLYAKFRGTYIIGKIRSRFKANYSGDRVVISKKDREEKQHQFLQIKEIYLEAFNKISMFHFNSSITEYYFRKYIKDIKGECIPITLKHISDNRKVKSISQNVRLTYLGPPQKYKGYDFLINILDKVYEERKNFTLNVFFTPKSERTYLKKRGEGYIPDELEYIFSVTDLLLVPSQGMETFGLVVKEAMSYGTPVMVTNYVGAKDIIVNWETGIIAESEEWIKLLKIILDDREILERFNQNIVNGYFENIDIHTEKIEFLYVETIKKLEDYARKKE